MQQIVRNLLADIPDGEPLSKLSPWVELRVRPLEDVYKLEEKTYRRFLKTHLPQNNLPQSRKPCYIYIVRDGRDVVWSFHNHHKHIKDEFYQMLNAGEFDGPNMPIFNEDVLDEVAYFERWLQRDGYPIWNFFEHIRSWWTVRDHPCVLLVHFEDMKKDLPGEITKIYRFLKMHGDVKEGTEKEVVESAVAKSDFNYMKMNAEAILHGVPKCLIHKGTNNRWKDVLPEELSELYEKKIVDELGEECANWVMTGSHPANEELSSDGA